MRKLITNYTFDKTNKQVTLTDYVTLNLEKLFLIVDVTNNITIYQANNPSKGATVSGNVITLDYDTNNASFSNSDNLQIFYEEKGQKTMAESQSIAIASDQTALPITDNGGSLTVDGTVAATQSGTWNINNISGTISLPSGAATSAKQPALGTAGTPSADVITVQGAVSMTALKVDGSAVTQPVSGTVTVTGTVTANLGTIDNVATETTQAETHGSADGGTAGAKSNLAGAIFNSSAPFLTNGQQVALQVSSSGSLKVDGSATTQPVSGTVTANAGTGSFTVAQATAANFNAQAVGNVAAGASDAGNPLKIGGLAKTTQPTAVTDGQRSNILTDKLGRVIVAPLAHSRSCNKCNNSNYWYGRDNYCCGCGGNI